MRKNFKAAKREPLPKIWVEPIGGQRPRDHKTLNRLPAKGGWVPDNYWWNRRIRHKEVSKPQPQPKPKPKPKPPKKSLAKPSPAKLKPTPKASGSEE